MTFKSITGHALHEKGLQKQKSSGPRGSSQEQRALLVLLIKPDINRSSTRHFVLAFGLNKILLARASDETFERCVLDALVGTRDACLLGGLFCRRPILTDPAPPPRRALRPDPPVVCSGFGFDR